MKLLNMVMVRNLCYIQTDTEPLCIEFCNVVQYHAFAYYLIVCWLVHLRVPINSIWIKWFKFIAAI
jgi:hypothetical protein